MCNWNKLKIDPLTISAFSKLPKKTLVFEFLKYLNAKDLCAEDKRLLYVACTRAIKTLHLSAEIKFSSNEKLSSPPKRSLLASIWPF